MLLFTSWEAWAQCGASINAVAGDESYTVTVNGSGSCPFTNLQLFRDGQPAGEWFCPESTCTKVSTAPTSCMAAGTYNFRLVVTCRRPVADDCSNAEAVTEEATGSFTLSGTPTINITKSGPSASGEFTGTVEYDLPRYPGFTSGRLDVSWETPSGVVSSSPVLSNATHAIPWQIYTSCWPAGSYTMRAKITSCTGETAETSKVLTVPPHTPTVEAEIHAEGPEAPYADVSWNFPQTLTSPERKVVALWNGSVIGETGRDVEQTGHFRVNLPACTVAGNDTLKVIAIACPGPNEERIEQPYQVVLPDCDVSCSCTIDQSSSPTAWLALPTPSNQPTPDCAGSPIRTTNGNMRMSDRDPLAGDILAPLVRVYDSRKSNGLFGRGWTSVFDAWLRHTGGVDDRDLVSMYTESGDRLLFERVDGAYQQVWPVAQSATGSLFFEPATGRFLHRDAGEALVRVFSADGRLVALRVLGTEREVILEYDAAGSPQRVADAHGAWEWVVTLNAEGRVAGITVNGSAPLGWTYTYDPSGNLISVNNTGAGVWRTYIYGGWGMEEARDGAGNLLESHAYDGSGRAVTSGGARGDITGIQYRRPGRIDGETVTRVTYASGRTTDYYSRYLAGKMRTVQVDGSCDAAAKISFSPMTNMGEW